MATKIINVLKSDTFDEVFDAFQASSAGEVILMIPRNSKLTKKEAHFAAFKKEADDAGKKISIMTEDEKTAETARAYNINVLYNRIEPKAKKSPKKVKESSRVIEEQRAILADEKSNWDWEAELTAAGNHERRRMADIVPEAEAEPVRIKEGKVKTETIEVRREEPEHYDTIEQKENEIEQIWASHREEAVERKPRRASKPMSRNTKWILAGVLFLAVVGGVVYAVRGSVQITIQPKKVEADSVLDVTASAKFSIVDTHANQLPGQKFVINEEVSGNFPASGQKTVAQKSRGRIKIFSSADKPQRLVATTRFESTSGLIFRIPQTITVPAGVKSADGKIIPGTIESDVFADRPGPEYNIDPSSFKIPGFKGLPQYDQFSALSSAPMAGGIIGPSKVVSEADFAKAKEELTKKLQDKIVEQLKVKASDLFFINKAVAVKVEEPQVNVGADEAADELRMTLRGSATTVAFKESDLAILIDNVLRDDNGGLILSQEKLNKDFQNVIVGTDDSLNFRLKVTGATLAAINKTKLTADIIGMGPDQIKSYFSDIKEVASVKLAFPHFWTKTVPANPEKIKILLEE